MQPGIIKKITHQYTQAFNTMLRKQLRLYTSDLKKDVQKKISALPSDVALLKGIQVRRKVYSSFHFTFAFRFSPEKFKTVLH